MEEVLFCLHESWFRVPHKYEDIGIQAMLVDPQIQVWRDIDSRRIDKYYVVLASNWVLLKSPVVLGTADHIQYSKSFSHWEITRLSLETIYLQQWAFFLGPSDANEGGFLQLFPAEGVSELGDALHGECFSRFFDEETRFGVIGSFHLQEAWSRVTNTC